MRRPATLLRRPGAFGLVLLGLTAVGLALRLDLVGESLFADELATAWVVGSHTPRGVISTVRSDAEITPPLLFVLAKASSALGNAPQLLRVPSVVAGTLTVPVVGLIGARTVGRPTGLIAAAVVACSPFMAYYSTEARGYALMICALAVSTLAVLLAVDTGLRRWWVLFGVATASAAYSHYTCIFWLAAQLAWLLITHPRARRPALLATFGAVLAFLPWIGGFRADLNSPTGRILASLSPFRFYDVRVNLEHWAVGYPYAAVGFRQVPGTPALVFLGLALLGGSFGLVRHFHATLKPTRSFWKSVDARVALVVTLALATPVGVALQSATSSSIFSMRNIAASWPAFALLLALIVMKAPGRTRWAASALLVASFGLGGVRMLTPYNGRPDYSAAASYVRKVAQPGGVVVDATAAVSPGPLSSLDPFIDRDGFRLVRGGAPAERDHPFTIFDRIVPMPEAIRRGVAEAAGDRLVVVSTTFPGRLGFDQRRKAVQDTRVGPPYVLVAQRVWSSALGAPQVKVYDRRVG